MCPIKRWLILSFILIFCPLKGFPQEVQVPAIKDNLYAVALFASVSEMEKSYGYIDDSSDRSTIRTDYRRMPVEKIPEITDGLPSQQGNYRVEYLDSGQQMDRYKKLGKGFAILRIFPVQSDGSLLKIHVSVSYLTYEKHKFFHRISDWSDVEFHYDVAKRGPLYHCSTCGKEWRVSPVDPPQGQRRGIFIEDRELNRNLTPNRFCR